MESMEEEGGGRGEKKYENEDQTCKSDFATITLVSFRHNVLVHTEICLMRC